MIALLNENSASDGDIFPYMFRAAGLGQLVGKRSWGGVVGISNRGTLLDWRCGERSAVGIGESEGRSTSSKATESIRISKSTTIRSRTLAGHDPQLERAVADVDEEAHIAEQAPPHPKDPVKAGN
jgi:tricorn protease